MATKSVTPETKLKREIVAWLEYNGIDTWPVPISPMITARGRAKNPMRGHPDRAGVFRGRYLAIEIKAPGWAGELKAEQAAWRERLENAGALYILATSVADVEIAIAAGRVA